MNKFFGPHNKKFIEEADNMSKALRWWKSLTDYQRKDFTLILDKDPKSLSNIEIEKLYKEYGNFEN